MYQNLLLICGLWFVSISWANEVARYVLPKPISGYYNAILANKTDKVMVFAYQGRKYDKSITIIDFPTLAEQGEMFNRAVVFLELNDPKQRKILNDGDLAQFIQSIGQTPETLAYGNNFTISDLVVFFNYANDDNIQLNAEELALRQHLLTRRLIKFHDGFYQARFSEAIVLSIPQIDDVLGVDSVARSTILSHEMSHGEYATDSKYREFCRNFWHSVMTEQQRTAFRDFLKANDYNPNNEELMINETQAYLMYTADSRAFSPEKVRLSPEEIADLRKKFIAGSPNLRQPPEYSAN
ncbi:hypothetical protein TI03_02700 [Achromatium sp. WMS1]|nr:hypothetical protein TI03_02700 [Achromatium sp. WMS1]